MEKEEIHKIAEVLILSGSELREETIQRYTEFVIKILGKCKDAQELINYTYKEFGIFLNIGEVEDALSILKELGKVAYQNGYWFLSEEASSELEDILNAEYEQQLSRLQDFKKSFKSYGSSEVNDDELEELFSIYNEYIIECIFIYGKLTSLSISSQDNGASESDLHNVLSSSLKKIKKQKIKSGFETYIKELPDCLTSRELNYLETLSNRAENFFALGLSKELAHSFFKIQPFEWVILLDTNVLYSILKIRDHAENPAVNQLLEIFIKWKDIFKITLRFLPDTYEELKLAKGELESKVVKARLTDNQIKAALRADKVDDFTKAYYLNILEHGKSALHPSEIVGQSIHVLKSKGIEKYQSKFQNIDTDSESFKDLLSAYNQFQQIKNEARREKGILTRDKSISLIEHDVYLREAVKDLRDKNCPLATHFQECKYFGLTLDKVLIDFDRYIDYKIKRDDSTFIPAFFLPSLLLKRIYKFVPVQSDDYKKAFISSITRPVFSSKVTTERSKLTQNALNKFYALGIDDPNFILKSVTNELFVKELSNKDAEEEAFTFIENEISKQLKEADRNLKQTRKTLVETKEAFSEKSEQLDVSLESLSELANKERLLHEEKEFLMNQLKKMREKGEKSNEQKTEAVQVLIPFDQAEADKKINKAASVAKQLIEEKREEHITKSYQSWKWKPVVWLVLSSMILIGFCCYLISQHEWNPDKAYVYYKNYYENHPSLIVFWTLGALVLTVADVFIIKEIQKRWHDPKNIEAFKNSIFIPRELRDEFIEEQLK